MLAGTVFSAIGGGMAGLALALSCGHNLLQIVIAYQLGGLIAVLAFITAMLPQPKSAGAAARD